MHSASTADGTNAVRIFSLNLGTVSAGRGAAPSRVRSSYIAKRSVESDLRSAERRSSGGEFVLFDPSV